MKEDVKQHLLDTGESLMRINGYNNTGIKDVLDEAGVPKGSFYYYFDSKEEFGLSIIESYVNRVFQQIQGTLNDRSKDGKKRFRSFLQGMIRAFEGDGFQGGCILGTLGQEMSDVNDNFRKIINSKFDLLLESFRNCILDARKSGSISTDADAGELAEFILTGWYGVQLRMKVTKSTKQGRIFLKYVFDDLLK